MQKGVLIIKKIKSFGYIITIICIYYLFQTVLALDINIINIFRSPKNVYLIIFYSLSVSILLYVSAFAWKLILNYLANSDNTSYSTISRVFIRTNIAKYLPGNIMHFAGRNVLGSQLGWKHSTIALSSLLEIILLLITASFLSLIFNYNKFIELILDSFTTPFVITLALICLVLGLIIIIATNYFGKIDVIQTIIDLLISKGDTKKIYSVVILYIFLYISQGIIFLHICTNIAGIDITGGYLHIIGTYILSWLIGFITPGSPGGIGVRESTLVLLLSPIYGTNPILIAALINRLTSISGDVLALLIQTLMDSRHNKFLKLY